MNNDSQDSEGSDSSNLSDSEWAPRLDGVIGEVFGSSGVVGGYNALEEMQRRSRLEAMTQHQTESHLWYRGLTLYFVAQYGQWDLSGIPQERIEARRVQMDLLGLGLSSAKSGIDTLLAGYYSITYATIRHMMETVLQWFYLDAFPNRAYLWRTPPTEKNIKRMAARNMRDKLLSQTKDFEPENERQAYQAYFERLYRYWELMSAGSHPSGAGLAQVVGPDTGGDRQIGGTYDRYMALLGFDYGLFALRELLSALETTNRVDEEWRQRLYQWDQGVGIFREGLRSDPDVTDVQADLEAVRKANADTGEHG